MRPASPPWSSTARSRSTAATTRVRSPAAWSSVLPDSLRFRVNRHHALRRREVSVPTRRHLTREDKCLYAEGGAIRMGSTERKDQPAATWDQLFRGSIRSGGRFRTRREAPAVVEEQRLATLGMSDKGNLLVVAHAFREPNTIRMISVWKANKRQKGTYEENRR